MRDEYGGLDQVVADLAEGSISTLAYVESLIARWRKTTHLNAITHIDVDSMLSAAAAVDRKRQAHVPLSLLAGVPFGVKDNIDVRGFPTTAGCKALERGPATANAVLVQKLVDCDAIVFGKTNMHELALGGTTNNPSYGRTLNPRAPGRVPGGSSGGSAAAVAAGIVPFALGTDTAASVRLPAALCGVAGFRPTTASAKIKHYSDEGVIPVSFDTDTIGLIARTVRDIALIDGVLQDRSEALVPPSELRIGVPSGYFFDETDADVRRALLDAYDRLASAGFRIIEVDVSGYVEKAATSFFEMMYAALVHDVPPFLRREYALTLPELAARVADQDVRSILEDAIARAPGSQVLADLQSIVRPELQYQYRDMFKSFGVDVLAYPTCPILPPRNDGEGSANADGPGGRSATLAATFVMVRNTVVGSFVGSPGISLPLPVGREAIPIGMEVEGMIGQDAALLAAASAMEIALQ